MKRKQTATLTQIFARPVPGGIRWADIEALFIGLGAEMSEREEVEAKEPEWVWRE